MAGETTPSKTAALVKVFDCPSCGGQVQLLASGQSLSAVCASCHSIIDVSNKNYRILSESKIRMKVEPYLSLGEKGVLFGDKWQVIGFMQRSDGTGIYFWHEYLLFNPYKGFRWLFCYQGHWTFYEMVKDKPSSGRLNTLDFEGENYRIYLRGQAKVSYVLGEFYWKVKVGETSNVADFIHPPNVLSKEEYQSEVIWSKGVYVDRSVLQGAFKVTDHFPAPVGVAPNQPSPYAAKNRALWGWTFVFFGAMTVLQILSQAASREASVFAQGFSYSNNDPNKMKVSPKFVLPGDLANLQVIGNADVSNNWMDLDMTLVNDTTGQKYVFHDGIEYYYGTDSDGAWSEGSRTNDVILPEVPGGTYYLTLQPTASVASANYGVEVKRDVCLWSNYWLALFMLLLFPLFAAFQAYRFEVSRWSESDYSPYQSSDDSDDD